MGKKCKYWSSCKYYDEENPLCVEEEGKYYEDEYSGCYRDLEKEKDWD